MQTEISPTERKRIAELCGEDEQYLYQCLTGRRDMDPKKAVRIEVVSERAILRTHLNKGWRDIWPELIGQEGAPTPPNAVAEQAGEG